MGVFKKSVVDSDTGEVKGMVDVIEYETFFLEDFDHPHLLRNDVTGVLFKHCTFEMPSLTGALQSLYSREKVALLQLMAWWLEAHMEQSDKLAVAYIMHTYVKLEEDVVTKDQPERQIALEFDDCEFKGMSEVSYHRWLQEQIEADGDHSEWAKELIEALYADFFEEN